MFLQSYNSNLSPFSEVYEVPVFQKPGNHLLSSSEPGNQFLSSCKFKIASTTHVEIVEMSAKMSEDSRNLRGEMLDATA